MMATALPGPMGFAVLQRGHSQKLPVGVCPVNPRVIVDVD